MEKCIECDKEKPLFRRGRCNACFDRTERNRRQQLLPKHLCACGCGEMIPIRTIRNQPMRYKRGHMLKAGETHPGWKGGTTTTTQGYLKIKKRDHQFADGKGYVMAHRLVYEEYHKCCLLPWIEIHHIIPIKEGGTNDINNLQPITKSDYLSISHKGKTFNKKDMSDRYCWFCGNKTYTNKKYEMWYIYKNRFICLKCHHKIIL